MLRGVLAFEDVRVLRGVLGCEEAFVRGSVEPLRGVLERGGT